MGLKPGFHGQLQKSAINITSIDINCRLLQLTDKLYF